MRNRLIVIIVLICIAFSAILILRPYSSLEINAGTIYYQSYINLLSSTGSYVRELEDYNDTGDEIHLVGASNKLNAIIYNIIIFKLADQIDFRNTYINEKVVKTDFLGENLNSLKTYYIDSNYVINNFLGGNTLEDTTFQDFLYYNQLILNGLKTNDLGYNPETKEFRVVLDVNNKPLVEEGLTGLKEMIIETHTN